MFPPKGSGLEQIFKRLEEQYPGLTLIRTNESPNRYCNIMKNNDVRALNIQSPLQTLERLQTTVKSAVSDLTKNFTNVISQISRTVPLENYAEVAAGFIPAGASLLNPEYPKGSDSFILADLDGDLKDEIITSYRHNDGNIQTIILKKQNESWSKIAEINNPQAAGIHYKNTVNIMGEKNPQLLIGLATDDKNRVLHCYSLNKDGIKELFTNHYNKLEVLGLSKNNESKARFALWKENDDETYNVEVFDWNGKQFDSINTERYYNKNVLPYYINKVKRQPANVNNWYLLADALEKAGAKKEARSIIEYGKKHDRNSEFNDRFENLISRL